MRPVRCSRSAEDLSKEWMRLERVRKFLFDSQHLGGLVTVHGATPIALNAEMAIE